MKDDEAYRQKLALVRSTDAPLNLPTVRTGADNGDNVLVVAISNRRHLLPEYHSDNKS